MGTPISDKALKKIQEVLEGYPKRWTGSHVCAYWGIDRDTGENASARHDRDRAHNGDVCHAGLSGYTTKDPIVVNAHRPNWDNPEYLLWAAADGPFKHGVLNRENKDEILKHGSVLDFAEIGIGGALWTCKVCRHFTEDTHVPRHWTKLREEGLDGLQAFFGAVILNADGSARVGTTHTSVLGYTNPKSLREIYDEFKNATRIDNYNVSKGVYNYGDASPAKVWGSLKGKQIKKPDGWGGFRMVDAPGGEKEYAASLKEIFEGDPKNVK